MYLMYLDESGIRNPRAKKVREDSNFFTLSGVIIKEKDFHKVTMDFRNFRESIFPESLKGKPIHAVELNNLKYNKKSMYQNQLSPEEAKDILRKAYNLISKMPLEAIAVIIDHHELCKKYPVPKDPYELSYAFLLEKFQKIISKRSDQHNSLGLINVAHCENSVSKKIMNIHNTTMSFGSKYVSEYNNILPLVNIEPLNKSEMYEIADIVCYAFSRAYRSWLCKNLKMKLLEEPSYLDIINPICNLKIGKILMDKANLKIFPYPRFLEDQQKTDVNHQSSV